MRLPLALLFVALLAGCADADPAESTPEPTAEPTPAPTSAPEPSDNGTRSLAAFLEANVTVGVVPLNVTFLLNGTGDVWGFDAEADGELEQRGEALPASVNHTFTEPGLWNATLTVRIGDNETTAVVQINATAPAAAPEPQVVEQTLSASWDADNVACTPAASHPKEVGMAGTNWDEHDVDAGTWGQTFLAAFSTNSLSNAEVSFYDALGTEIANFDDGETLDWNVRGVVPVDAATVVFWNCISGTGGTAEYTSPE